MQLIIFLTASVCLFSENCHMLGLGRHLSFRCNIQLSQSFYSHYLTVEKLRRFGCFFKVYRRRMTLSC